MTLEEVRWVIDGPVVGQPVGLGQVFVTDGQHTTTMELTGASADTLLFEGEHVDIGDKYFYEFLGVMAQITRKGKSAPDTREAR